MGSQDMHVAAEAHVGQSEDRRENDADNTSLYAGGLLLREHRRMLCSVRNGLHRQGLRCVFQQWCALKDASCHLGLLDRLHVPWMADIHASVAVRSHQLRLLAGQLRRQCRRDKVQHLHDLAVCVDTSPADVQTACRRLLRPKNKRSGSRRPLPSLIKENHFSSLESGQEVTAERWSRNAFRISAGLAPSFSGSICQPLRL